MSNLKQAFRTVVDSRVRDSLWAWRSRGDLSVFNAVVRDGLGFKYRVGSNLEHLEATMQWLCAAQDATAEGGIAAFYDVRKGVWGPPYPETTGYIIPNFFDYASFTGDTSYRLRADRMADWLVGLQLENGAFPIGPLWPDWNRDPIVFDTGQIIFGLVRAFEETGKSTYIESAEQAGDWLASILDEDGSWRLHTSKDIVHTYNVRVAWALLCLSKASRVDKYSSCAVRNLEWTLTQQMNDGWFQNAGFTPQEAPLTHTIAYTIEGLLESGVLLSDQRMIDSARRGADGLMLRQERDGYLRARYGVGWSSETTWSCLTGDAQMALIWLRLYQLTEEDSYLKAAQFANRYIKRTQNRKAKHDVISGGIAGSFPIYGDYEPYRLLNWAAKFFVDSLLLEESIAVDN